MATKSFLKNINIKSANQARKLVNALEKAQNFKGDEVIISRNVNELQRADIKNFAKNLRIK